MYRFKVNKKGQDRIFSSPAEIETQLNEGENEEKENESEGDSSEEDSSEEEDSSSSDSSDQSSDEDDSETTSEESDSEDSSDSDDSQIEPKKPAKPKGVSALIDIENPNRLEKTKTKTEAPSGDTVVISRREQEELDRQMGKKKDPGEIKADLARLAEIKELREADAARKLQEKKDKEKAAAVAAAKAKRRLDKINNNKQ